MVGTDGWLAVRAELDRVWDCWIYSVWTTRWVCALDRDVTKYSKYKKTDFRIAHHAMVLVETRKMRRSRNVSNYGKWRFTVTARVRETGLPTARPIEPSIHTTTPSTVSFTLRSTMSFPQSIETSGIRARALNQARRRAINPFGDRYPDNNEPKDIFLQADGLETSDPDDRHVLLYWQNGNDETGTRYTQVIHLTGGPGNYLFLSEQVKAQSRASLERNALYNFGSYSRAQRDRIVAIATAVGFNRKSRVNNCQTWMRDLLLEMVKVDLLPLEQFNDVDKEVPLKKRVPEDAA